MLCQFSMPIVVSLAFLPFFSPLTGALELLRLRAQRR